MTDAKAMIKQGMAKNKIEHDYEQAERVGISKQSFSRKLDKPWTFTFFEVLRLAQDFDWTDEELALFVRAIGGTHEGQN